MPLESALYYSNDIQGSNSKGKREGSSVVIEFNHKVYSPTDDQRGIFTGSRVHSPVRIVKEIDTASPQLYQACAQGQTLDELKITWYRINPTGGEEQYFSHVFSGVKVASVEEILPNTKDPSKATQTHLEDVRFMYEKMTWTHVDGYEFEDAWKDAVLM